MRLPLRLLVMILTMTNLTFDAETAVLGGTKIFITQGMAIRIDVVRAGNYSEKALQFRHWYDEFKLVHHMPKAAINYTGTWDKHKEKDFIGGRRAAVTAHNGDLILDYVVSRLANVMMDNNHRVKRGIFNGGGDAMQWIFGVTGPTARQHMKDEIKKAMALATQSEEFDNGVVKFEKNTAMTFRLEEKEITQNRNHTKALEQVVMEAMNAEREDVDILWSFLMSSSTVTALSTEMLDFINIYEHIAMTAANGYLSPALISHEELRRYITTLVLKEDKLGPPFRPSEAHLYYGMDICELHQEKGKIEVTTTIPMVDKSEVYHLEHAETPTLVRFPEATYQAIGEDGGWRFLTKEDLRLCKTEPMTETKYCNLRRIKITDKETFVYDITRTDIYIEVMESAAAELECPNGTTKIQLSETQILSLSAKCRLHGAGFFIDRIQYFPDSKEHSFFVGEFFDLPNFLLSTGHQIKENISWNDDAGEKTAEKLALQRIDDIIAEEEEIQKRGSGEEEENIWEKGFGSLQAVMLTLVTLYVIWDFSRNVRYCWLQRREKKKKKEEGDKEAARGIELGPGGTGTKQTGNEKTGGTEAMLLLRFDRRLQSVEDTLSRHIKVCSIAQSWGEANEKNSHSKCSGEGLCKIRMDNLESKINRFLGHPQKEEEDQTPGNG